VLLVVRARDGFVVERAQHRTLVVDPLRDAANAVGVDQRRRPVEADRRGERHGGEGAAVKVLALGVRHVVLGTAAVERLGLVEEACRKFPGRVRTGIDARNGEVKVAGWLEGTGLTAVEVARRVKAAGVSLVEYTDVGRDGMFTGVDHEGAARIQAEAGVEVVASGGVASLADVRACKAAGLAGVIVGKALYEGRIQLAAAIRASQEG